MLRIVGWQNAMFVLLFFFLFRFVHTSSPSHPDQCDPTPSPRHCSRACVRTELLLLLLLLHTLHRSHIAPSLCRCACASKLNYIPTPLPLLLHAALLAFLHVTCNRVSLPEDATRDGVNLVITPKNTLRVSYAFEGRRPLFKDVSLPKDADLSQISAKFKAEQKERAGESGENYVAVGAVSGLEITVGKAAVPEPKRVHIE